MFGIGQREGEQKPDLQLSPIYVKLCKESELFKAVSLSAHKVLKEHKFYDSDIEFLIVISTQMTRHIEEDYIRNGWDVVWGLARMEYGLSNAIRSVHAQLRLDLLATPSTYLIPAGFRKTDDHIGESINDLAAKTG